MEKKKKRVTLQWKNLTNPPWPDKQDQNNNHKACDGLNFDMM